MELPAVALLSLSPLASVRTAMRSAPAGSRYQSWAVAVCRQSVQLLAVESAGRVNVGVRTAPAFVM